MVLPAPIVSEYAADQRDPAEHEPEKKLSGQFRCGEFLGANQKRVILFADVSVHGTV